MSDETSYTVESDFYRTGKVTDLELSQSSKGLSRKVLRATLIDNPKANPNCVEICLVHQRRSTASAEWADISGPTLAKTTVSVPSKVNLDTAETRVLFDHLVNLFDIGPKGIRPGKATVQILRNEEEIIRIDASRARLIRRLLEGNHGTEVWERLLELEPDLARKLSITLAHQERVAVIAEFETAIGEDRDEQYWKALLKRNRWLLGSANISILPDSRIDTQHIADIPLAVDGGFMDLVELKRPDVPFWQQRPTAGGNFHYRGKFLIPDYGLQGAITQTTHYILQAEKHVSDSDFRESHGIKPLKPRGLVVHGRSNNWGAEEWEAFRLLNDNLHGIQVMTFDHLLEQGRRALKMGSETE